MKSEIGFEVIEEIILCIWLPKIPPSCHLQQETCMQHNKKNVRQVENCPGYILT